MKTKRNLVGLLLVLVAVLLSACAPTQERIADRDAALGRQQTEEDSNFQEALQIQSIEEWKDEPGKIVLWYVNFPPGSDNVIPLQCKGVPGSSTESLEPNIGHPYTTGSSSAWRVPIDGVDTLTEEMAGRDGTYGEPVAYRQCFTVDGQYFDLPAMGVPYIVTSAVLSFPPSTVKRDFEAEVRLLQAEEVIKQGGCVNPETLEKIECAN